MSGGESESGQEESGAGQGLTWGAVLSYILTKPRASDMHVAVAEAKDWFAELLRRLEKGEEIELTRLGRPMARIVGMGQGDLVSVYLAGPHVSV